MLTPPPNPLCAGDRVPNFMLPDSDRRKTMLYERVTGRPVALVFFGPAPAPLRPAALAACEKAADAFNAAGIDVRGLTAMPIPEFEALKPRIPVWADPRGQVIDQLLRQMGLDGAAGLGKTPVVAVIDGNQRLIEVFSGGQDLARRIIDVCAGRVPQPLPEGKGGGAPVIVMDNLIDQGMCDDLIAMFETGDVYEGAITTGDGSGGGVSVVSSDLKKRLDCRVEDPELHKILTQTLGRRVGAELEKAFHFSGFFFDTFRICRYAADRGDRFRAHRDDTAPTTRDRRFALTLNLNASDYDGGELIFAEYGPEKFKTGNGGGVVFSCSLLHEALPVTRGVRYALLSFLRDPNHRELNAPR